MEVVEANGSGSGRGLSGLLGARWGRGASGEKPEAESEDGKERRVTTRDLWG